MAFSDPDQLVGLLNLVPGDHVADVGAGSGAYSFSAARRVGSHGRVFALEVQEEFLDDLEKEVKTQGLPWVVGVWANVEKLGGTRIKEDSMNAVIMANILFQVQDKEDFVKEMKRIGNKETKYLLVDWSDSYSGVGPHPDELFPPEEAREFFTQRGFSVGQQFKAGDHHYGYLMRQT